MSSQVIWSYGVGGVVFAVGLAVIGLRGDWRAARGFDRLIVFGPVLYAAPLAAFGTEHFTDTRTIASLVPDWLPWHPFWAYVVGACFIAAALSMVTRVETQLAATLLAVTFFLFVVLMDVPALVQTPRDRFALALAFRELTFSAGALALAASLMAERRPARAHVLATVARIVVGTGVVVYAVEQFLHGDHVPAIPLEAVTPTWIYGHAMWTYLAAAAYAVAGPALLLARKPRVAAACVGAAVLVVELFVYLPFAVANRHTLEGINYAADTLMYGGAVLLLAAAMPRGATRRPSATDGWPREARRPQIV